MLLQVVVMRHFVLGVAVGLAVSGCGSEAGGGPFDTTAGGAGIGGEGTGAQGGSPSAGGGGLGGVGGGAGGQGGSAGGGTGGGAVSCDAIGACGNTGRGCVKCAIEGACAAAYAACFDSVACGDYSECVTMCGGTAACVMDCGAQHPAGQALFTAYESCVLCRECLASCRAADACAPP